MGYRLQVPSSRRSTIGIFLSDQPSEFNPSQRSQIWISLSTTINNLNFPLHKDQQFEFPSPQLSTTWIFLFTTINNLNFSLPKDQQSQFSSAKRSKIWISLHKNQQSESHSWQNQQFEFHSSQISTIWIALFTKFNNLNLTLDINQQSESHSWQKSTIWIYLNIPAKIGSRKHAINDDE